jgi:acyl carrier protein
MKQKVEALTTQKNIKNSDALLAIIKETIAHKLAREIESIGLNKHIVNDLGADSLDLVEIIMAFEDKFDIEIPDNDAETLRYIKDFFVYLSERLIVV